MSAKLCFFLSIVLLFGCASNETVEENAPSKNQQTAEQQQTEPEQEQTTETQDNEDLPPGTPVANANHQIKQSEKEIAEVLKLIQMAQRGGDVTLECEDKAPTAYRILSGFFNPSYFRYDNDKFWFITKNGRVTLNAEEGKFYQCKFGVFSTTKRLITYQKKGDKIVETQFYVDESLNTLNVHYYREGSLQGSKNYDLTTQ